MNLVAHNPITPSSLTSGHLNARTNKTRRKTKTPQGSHINANSVRHSYNREKKYTDSTSQSELASDSNLDMISSAQIQTSSMPETKAYDQQSHFDDVVLQTAMPTYASASSPVTEVSIPVLYEQSTAHGVESLWQQASHLQEYHHRVPPAYFPPPPPLPKFRKASEEYDKSTFIRTLVGPLAANAARLNDEYGQPGWFFVFQDLSVRTEGMYVFSGHSDVLFQLS